MHYCKWFKLESDEDTFITSNLYSCDIIKYWSKVNKQTNKYLKQPQGQDVTCHVHVSDKARLFGIHTDSNEVHICTNEIDPFSYEATKLVAKKA